MSGVHAAHRLHRLPKAFLAAVLGVSLLAPIPAQADELSEHQARVEAQMAKTRAELNESSKALSAAAVAVDRTSGQLELAKTQLVQTRADLAAARTRDRRLAGKLKGTRAALAAAKTAVAVGQRRLLAQQRRVGNVVRDQYQQQNNLLAVALLTEGTSTADLQTKLQWSTTLFDTASAEIDRLAALQRRHKVQRARVTELERKVTKQRRAAAGNLKAKKSLERQAATQESDVAALLDQNRAIQQSAATEVAADQRQYAELTRERAAVEERIAVRLAQARAAAERKAAAEKAAAEQAAAEQAAAEKAAAEQAAADEAAAARRAAKKKAAAAQKRAEAAVRKAARKEAEAAERRTAQQEAETAIRRAKKAAREARRAADQAEEKAREVTRWAPKRSSGSSKSSSSSSSHSPSSHSSSSGSTSSVFRSSSSGGGSSAAHGFSYPVPARITSPYGMRFHPVLRYWKLHDGTDFGAGCGTAIRAPYAGRVAERYYNVGYGNRLMIDHGFVDGRFVTTGYNHAIRYTVSVGERVSKGEIVGYVGSTGFSTGCHLHLMTWLDGGRVNPMTWF